jgi:hypothetical protein
MTTVGDLRHCGNKVEDRNTGAELRLLPTVRSAKGPTSMSEPGVILVVTPVMAWEIVDSAVVAEFAPLVACWVASGRR